MSCSRTESVHVSSNVARAKTGYLRRLNKGLFSDKWKQEFFVLYVDSTLAWFADQGSYEPKGAVLLKDVCQYMAVGATTQYIPGGPPKVPPGSQMTHLMGVPRTCSRQAEFVWILCSDQHELEAWLQAITSVLPPPPQPPPQQQQQPPPYPPHGGPPPPPPTYGGQPGYPPQHGYPPPHPGYHHGHRQQPYGGYGNQPQTVVVQQRDRDRGDGGASFATGMLIGGALGYGLARPWGWGWGYPYGGYGWGSGISINNHYDIDHTHIENNQFTENNYDYGGGDYGGGDYGGGDFGGGDYGDFGGGDFGGGDFGGDCDGGD